MGKQCNFFQTENDVQKFYQFIKQNNFCLYFNNTKRIASFVEVLNCELDKTIYISHNDSLLNILENNRYTWIDALNSEVIEWSPCFSSKNGSNYINNGRIYLLTEFYNNKLVFELYNCLIKYIKKNYKYSKNLGMYFAPDFYEKYMKKEVYACNSNNVFEF